MESSNEKSTEYKSYINQVDQMDIFKIINEIVQNKLKINDDDAFFLLNIDDLMMKYIVWVDKMPRVKPYYAVKCNDNEIVLKTLAELGTGFDCASKGELEMILKIGVESDRIIYANPTKQISHLRFAKEMKVKKMTCDSVEELYKIKSIYPQAEVVLRIRFDAKDALLSLGAKFGCDPVSEAPQLIELCKTLNLDLIGFSFHVGSGCKDFEIYEQALYVIRELFNFASTIGIMLNFVDIGGGFLGNNINLLDKYAKSINQAIETYFPDPSVIIISEPGRYFVSSAFTLVTNIHSKKTTFESSGQIRSISYYINDGLFASFLGRYLDGNLNECTYKTLKHNEHITEHYKSTLWGATCDSVDKIADQIMLPELSIGDWLVTENMGDYSVSIFTKFNGYKNRNIYPISTNFTLKSTS